MEKKVHKLQTRIYRASSRGDSRSQASERCKSGQQMSSGQVSNQDNREKKTAGVEIAVPRSTIELVNDLELETK